MSGSCSADTECKLNTRGDVFAMPGQTNSAEISLLETRTSGLEISWRAENSCFRRDVGIRGTTEPEDTLHRMLESP